MEAGDHYKPEAGIFGVKDCALIAIATGRSSHTLTELRDHLRAVSGGSIYYHFWGSLLQPRFEEREFNNDFASWVRHALHDAALAERLAVLDPTDFPDIDDLRIELIELIEGRLDEQESLAWVRSRKPFEFLRSQIVVFDTHRKATTPEELATLFPSLTTSSIFYHFIDARRRFPEGEDDFRAWVKNFGPNYERLHARLGNVDPYFAPLSEVRDQLSVIFSEFLRGVRR